jgi:Asp-tRNA(Asn)/Glu-tRNA(Gln) amidotransferase A subunit family amidase
MADSPDDNLVRLTAIEAIERIRAGSLSATQLAGACLDRIAKRDPVVRAWSHVGAEGALHQARERDLSPSDRPLHGIPIGIKDVLFTEDMPTEFNSPIYTGWHPRLDASAVAILRAAGAVILGKCDTVEFAVSGRKALTRNPWDTERTPGGSSSGSAAAVADCHVPLALGTQTGGSIIRPASYCGVYAFKPSWNLVSFEGAKTCSASMDTIGWFARSAPDLELLCEVFGITDDTPPARRSLAGARIALCRSPVWDRAEPSTQAAFAEAAKRLDAAGADLEELELPAPFSGMTEAHKIIMQLEMCSSFLAEYSVHRSLLYEEMQGFVENRPGHTHAALATAYDLAATCRAEFDRLARPFDAVLTPSAVGEAPPGLEKTGEAVFNRIWTLLHVPCVNVPGLRGPTNLPIGLTLTGPRFADRKVLAIAEAVGKILSAASG